MPYARKSELPDGVHDHRPAHAQDIYKEAYDSAFEAYKHDESRATVSPGGAVEKTCHKGDDGQWTEWATDRS